MQVRIPPVPVTDIGIGHDLPVCCHQKINRAAFLGGLGGHHRTHEALGPWRTGPKKGEHGRQHYNMGKYPREKSDM